MGTGSAVYEAPFAAPGTWARMATALPESPLSRRVTISAWSTARYVSGSQWAFTGFAGNAAPDHMDHLHALDLFF